MAEVGTRALKAAWYQKWMIHRRLRPERVDGGVPGAVATFIGRGKVDELRDIVVDTGADIAINGGQHMR